MAPKVRAFLLANARELVEGHLEGPGMEAGKPVPVVPVDIDEALAAGELVAQLLAWTFGYTALHDGDEYQLKRSELPDWHPLARAGHPGDAFALTAANGLVLL